MVRSLFRDAILIDTSAIVALEDPADQHHGAAKAFFEGQDGAVKWCSLNVTGHEAYTLLRYHRKQPVVRALEHYDRLRAQPVKLLGFSEQDEAETRRLLLQFDDQQLSFHDVLCAAVMLRVGILRVFTFDKDFAILGFQTLPGPIS